jgi:hypothetical protein
MRDDLGEYDKQKLLEFCWQCVLNEQETDVEIILNKFRDCNGEYKIAKEKKSITHTKEKTDELTESHNIMHRKKKYEYSEQEKNIEKKKPK